MKQPHTTERPTATPARAATMAGAAGYLLNALWMGAAILLLSGLVAPLGGGSVLDAPAPERKGPATATYPVDGLDYCVSAERARAPGVRDSVGPCRQRAAWVGAR